MARSLKGWLREYFASLEGWQFASNIQPVFDVSWSWLDRQSSGIVTQDLIVAGGATTVNAMVVPDDEVWMVERISCQTQAVGACEARCTLGFSGSSMALSSWFSGTVNHVMSGVVEFNSTSRLQLLSGDSIAWQCYNPTGGPITFRAHIFRHLVRP